MIENFADGEINESSFFFFSNPNPWTWDCCSAGYPFETHPKLKSCAI